ncbi:hypothetical protein [Flavobacterium maritimum]|uniref:hypothetical protein n=1 Tax=Flavobacterium maritimum TaxID=3149042 RepID=UPI0032B56F15
MNLSELLKEIYDSSKDRIKTPITGAYTIAFILWNWRPILVLLFEDAKISDKIIVINNEYCNLGAILGPFLIALIITIGVPFLMTLIDWSISSPKKTRLKYVYKTKISDSEYQIDLAKQELILQDIRSGNKEKQDFIDKIKQLENQIIDLNESNKTVVDSYKNQLNDLNNTLSINLKSQYNRSNKNNFYQKIIIDENLTEMDLERFSRFPKDTNSDIPFVNIGAKIINIFRKYDFLQKTKDSDNFLNEAGLSFVKWVLNQAASIHS